MIAAQGPLGNLLPMQVVSVGLPSPAKGGGGGAHDVDLANQSILYPQVDRHMTQNGPMLVNPGVLARTMEKESVFNLQRVELLSYHPPQERMALLPKDGGNKISRAER